MSDAGALLFARYAYPPNARGLCGADEPRTLLEYGHAHAADGGLAALATTFEGAWPYLELIAHANRVADPLDVRVVQAYWVGNELLDRVPRADLARHVEDRFRGRLGTAREHVVRAALAGAAPHHCFHVFAVYPWLGLLRSGVVDEPLRILESCRTTPARVVAVDGAAAVVSSRPLRWIGSQLVLDAPALSTVRWQEDGLGFVPALRPGDRVSLHWGFVCDALTAAEERALAAANARALAAVAQPSAPASVTSSRKRVSVASAGPR